MAWVSLQLKKITNGLPKFFITSSGTEKVRKKCYKCHAPTGKLSYGRNARGTVYFKADVKSRTSQIKYRIASVVHLWFPLCPVPQGETLDYLTSVDKVEEINIFLRNTDATEKPFTLLNHYKSRNESNFQQHKNCCFLWGTEKKTWKLQHCDALQPTSFAHPRRYASKNSAVNSIRAASPPANFLSRETRNVFRATFTKISQVWFKFCSGS